MKEPRTLAELLRVLERSPELRGLARDCGLTVRELRRRLVSWRRDIAAAENGDPDEGRIAGDRADAANGGVNGAAERWPELPDAAAIDSSPLPARGSRVLEIHTDGASKGNPGPAAIAAVFRQKGGADLCALSEAIGRATNNVAEYRAVVAALERCSEWGIGKVQLYVDSELVARQLQGVYRVKSADLRPLFQQAVFLSRGLDSFSVKHVPRERNAHADYLANRALMRQRGA
jgi:ribonuclease HI